MKSTKSLNNINQESGNKRKYTKNSRQVHLIKQYSVYSVCFKLRKDLFMEIKRYFYNEVKENVYVLFRDVPIARIHYLGMSFLIKNLLFTDLKFMIGI